MPARKPEPTKAEAQYLKELVKLRKEKHPFADAEIARRLGKGIATIWQIHKQCEEKGFLEPGEWQVRKVESAPVPTPKAKRYLRAA